MSTKFNNRKQKEFTNLNHFMHESWLIFNDRSSSSSNSDNNGSSTSSNNVTMLLQWNLYKADTL